MSKFAWLSINAKFQLHLANACIQYIYMYIQEINGQSQYNKVCGTASKQYKMDLT